MKREKFSKAFII